MKLLKQILILQTLVFLTCVQTFAATLPKSDCCPHQFSVGVEGFYYKYREPGLMESKGFLYGVNAAYNNTFGCDFFWQFDLRFDYGRTKYTSNGTGSLKHEPNWLFEGRSLLGKRFHINCQSHIDPYIGLGYRFKSDDTDGKRSTTGHVGYYRRSEYLYLPVGVTYHQNLQCGWSFAPTVEFDVFLRGKQRSDLIAATIHHTQKRGYGLRGDIMVTKQLNHGCISFGPFINYWNIRDSNVVLGYIEPHNKTIESGLKIKYTF